jgi:hypothetical protein
VTLQNLIAIIGDGAGPSGLPSTPARNITVRGIGFRDAGYTYMNPHGAPSGGDWAMQSPQYRESGALYVSGAEDINVNNCTFKYLDGNAVYLAGYTRQVIVSGTSLPTTSLPPPPHPHPTPTHPPTHTHTQHVHVRIPS